MGPHYTYRTLLRLGLPLCGWLSFALLVILASGVPIPVPFAKDLSRPFPCMFSRCGCLNAEQCWRSCCCHSLSERLAWAKAHNVQPPEYAISSAQSGAALAKSCADDARGQSCCAQKQQKIATKSGLSLTAALKCQGIGELVAGVPLCLPPPPFDWQPCAVLTATVRVDQLDALSPTYDPVSPPPRSPAC